MLNNVSAFFVILSQQAADFTIFKHSELHFACGDARKGVPLQW
jgi:hypothetical protein